ncbi:L,D-transpeptidase family protein [[Mycobacterium] kokjensenii]|uniref:L,D-transpeptidase family protein n=1 Tax=[Mycobacterium] kokjensenii TaxID=3064287 RepID=A0ABN9MUF4_9MYCO|nr:L,D-transpeptidase family protein [Mycolicibacter sp. MU0083]CAJ1493305.1 L,D-transpeptidase family protein [Mycolicibacter sp. MU0083]
MRRFLSLFSAALCTAVVTLAAAPGAQADLVPWFAKAVGNANQVISVVGVGGSDAKMDVYQRGPTGWQAVAAGIPAHVGSAGMAQKAKSGHPATPMGVFTLPYAFGTAPNPGGGLQYVQVGPDHWWDGDDNSPTFNTMQVCKKAQCAFNTNASENLEIPQYKHAVVMGVNTARTPGDGAGFFFHTTDGGPTAGCVAIDDAKLVQIIQWLRPGAVMAIAQ